MAAALRPKPVKGLGTRLQEAVAYEPLPNVERPEPLPLERDAAWWNAEIAAHDAETAPKRSV